jgi:hypothetical protein
MEHLAECGRWESSVAAELASLHSTLHAALAAGRGQVTRSKVGPC